MILLPHNGAIAHPLYAGNVRYYAALVAAGKVCFDIDAPMAKMRALNRTTIVGANGVQTLTIPLVKPTRGSATPVKELEISSHGDWRHTHWGAIFSAYGKSPFFEYFQDDLHAVFNRHHRFLVDFTLDLHRSIVNFFDLPIVEAPAQPSFDDIRSRVGDTTPDSLPIVNTPYYQVWQQRFGFIPSLSILDLVLNEGREATLRLLAMNNL